MELGGLRSIRSRYDLARSYSLNFLIIVICELCPTYSFLLPFSVCSFGNGRTGHLTDLLDASTKKILHIGLLTKYVIKLAKKFNFYAI